MNLPGLDFVRFDRGDRVRLKKDKAVHYVVVSIDLDGYDKYKPESAKAHLAQCGTGFPRFVPVTQLELVTH